jgi:hypothetical protein
MLDRPTLSPDSPMVRSDSACWLPRRPNVRLYASLRPTQVALDLRLLRLPEGRLDPVSATLRPYLPRWSPGWRIAPPPLRHLTVSRGLHREIPPTETRSRRSQFADPDLPTPGPCLLASRLGCPRLSSSSRTCGTDMPRSSACRHRLSVPLGSPSPVSRSVSACRPLGLRLSSHSRLLRACALNPRLPSLPKTLWRLACPGRWLDRVKPAGFPAATLPPKRFHQLTVARRLRAASPPVE